MQRRQLMVVGQVMDIHFATTNKGKIQSLQRELDKHGIIVIQEPLQLTEPQESDVKKVAEAKIQQAYATIQKPTIVLDAGFYIDGLKGFPGTYINFALQTIGLEGLLKLTDGTRQCEFRSCLAYMDSQLTTPEYFIVQTKGTMADKPRGTQQPYHWSKLPQIVIPEGKTKTIAEMTKEEYYEWKQKENSIGRVFYNWLSTNRDTN